MIIYIYMYTYACIYIYIYTYIHVYVHINTHIYVFLYAKGLTALIPEILGFFLLMLGDAFHLALFMDCS